MALIPRMLPLGQYLPVEPGQSLRCIDGKCVFKQDNTSITIRESTYPQIEERPKAQPLVQPSQSAQPARSDSPLPDTPHLTNSETESLIQGVAQPQPRSANIVSNANAVPNQRGTLNAVPIPVAQDSKTRLESGSGGLSVSGPELIASMGVLGALVAIVCFRLLSKKVMYLRLCRWTSSVNNAICGNAQILYGTPSSVARLTEAVITPSRRHIELRLLRLEHSRNSAMSTVEAKYATKIEKLRLPFVLRQTSSLCALPSSLCLNGEEWIRIASDSRYGLLVEKHHYYWSQLKEANALLIGIQEKLLTLNQQKSKYQGQSTFGDLGEKILAIRRHLTSESDAARALVVMLQNLIRDLTYAIESIEDFGGVLLGYEEIYEKYGRQASEFVEQKLPEVEAEIQILRDEIDALRKYGDRFAL